MKEEVARNCRYTLPPKFVLMRNVMNTFKLSGTEIICIFEIMERIYRPQLQNMNYPFDFTKNSEYKFF
jgi:hypothetical protein